MNRGHSNNVEKKISLDDLLNDQESLYGIEAVAGESDKVRITVLGSYQSLVLSKRVIKSVAESGESIVSTNGRKIKLVSILFADDLITEIFDQLKDTNPENIPESFALAFPPSPLQSGFDIAMALHFAKLAYYFGGGAFGRFPSQPPT
jgi:hypothetical protein